LTNLNYRDNSDDSEDDVQEAVKTLEIGKQLGLYAELEDKVLKNITKLRRSSRRRTTQKRFKWSSFFVKILVLFLL
jgi:hypothetical protein